MRSTHKSLQAIRLGLHSTVRLSLNGYAVPSPSAVMNRLRRGALVLLVGALLGCGIILAPAITAAGVLLTLVAVISTGWPQGALKVSFFVVLLANTKFRTRDPTASFAGDIDNQIMYELFLYAVVGVIALAGARSALFRRSRITLFEGVLVGFVVLALASSFWSLAPAFTAVRSLQLAIMLLLVVVAMRVLEPAKALTAVLGSAVFYVLLFASMTLAIPGVATGQVLDGMRRFAWCMIT